MHTKNQEPLDMIEELRLRRWARENYVPPEQRSPHWHQVIHDEMSRRDLELLEASPPHIIPSATRC
ncbi:MAG: hypothetical protein RMJ19_12060 [Gemmatales bacterium]|nr:hypothetical protein [Gemmatales bacterium]MDW8176400.1 hypothetical protein [Gemmatales bacterium]MDW8222644.1 hypothetical protein [Gemmatales bacterium]